MGFRFQKRIPLGKGVRLNLSKSGIGVSAGVKGFRVGVGPRGSTTRASIPGTGIGYEVRTKTGRRQRSTTENSQPAAVEQRLHESRRGHPWLWILAGVALAAGTGSPWWLIVAGWGLVVLFRGRGRNPIPPAVLVATILAFSLSTHAFAHSGGLDQCGGHYNRRTGQYHVHNWTNYYNCYGWPEALVDPVQDLRKFLGEDHSLKKLLDVREDVLEQLHRLDAQLCELMVQESADENDALVKLLELVESGALICSGGGT